MTETWRKKTYYEKRVLIETDRILESEFDDSIICLTGAELELLRNLMQYAHRRSTFVSEYAGSFYLAPDNDQWDQIDALVAGLELKLMGCDIDTLVAAIEAQTEAIAALGACVCASSEYQRELASRLPDDMTPYTDAGTVTYLSPDETRGDPDEPATDEAKCALAQAFYAYVFDMYTETLLPFANSTADAICAILVATALVELESFVGIPVAVLSFILAAFMAWAIDGNIADFTNWMWAAKDEIVCTLYNNFPDLDAAAAALRAFLETQSELSILDKALLRSVLCSAWHMSWILEDQQTNGTWDAYITPGYCSECETPPAGCVYLASCDISDWTGGEVVCHSGYPWIESGKCQYNAQVRTSPAYPAWIGVYWYPRSSIGETATIQIGVYDVTTSTEHMLFVTNAEPIDVLAFSWTPLPAVTGGHELKLIIKQEAYFGEPRAWCLLDAEPS
jgi:hypothetical protein